MLKKMTRPIYLISAICLFCAINMPIYAEYWGIGGYPKKHSPEERDRSGRSTMTGNPPKTIDPNVPTGYCIGPFSDINTCRQVAQAKGSPDTSCISESKESCLAQCTADSGGPCDTLPGNQ